MTVSTCEQLSTELVAFLDGELPDAERRPIAAHLSTCLGCRREIDRLTKVQRLVGNLAAIEPSGDFAARFWQRMEVEPEVAASRRTRSRPLRWAVPALAAAAVLAVVFQFAAAPKPPSPAAPAARERMVQAPGPPAARPAPGAQADAARAGQNDHASQLAGADDALPEDLPPQLLEHPELFLRLPVVRRLEKLEHFEEVRQREQDDTVGSIEWRARGGAG